MRGGGQQQQAQHGSKSHPQPCSLSAATVANESVDWEDEVCTSTSPQAVARS